MMQMDQNRANDVILDAPDPKLARNKNHQDAARIRLRQASSVTRAPERLCSEEAERGRASKPMKSGKKQIQPSQHKAAIAKAFALFNGDTTGSQRSLGQRMGAGRGQTHCVAGCANRRARSWGLFSAFSAALKSPQAL
ncbi:hypothetical protein GOBAR_AA31566 [Gossypium barbadense]|uniref:Uncharacterized protein n=1 Tax=Gossypium barbadense TaxID=3634 RepID=A0A2P5WDG8_GOSBA|nr:hypothetical protein GOBAR_AA31566 [Gossypium barbadense]